MKQFKWSLMIFMLLFVMSDGAFADATQLAKEADKMIRNAERLLYSGKSHDANVLLNDAYQKLQQGKTEEPNNRMVVRVEKKFARTKSKVDRKLKQSVKSTPAASKTTSSNAGTPQKLPGGVKKRLRDINSNLDIVERRGQNYKLKAVEEIFAEIEQKYAGKFSAEHPDYVSAKARFNTLSKKRDEQATAAAAEKLQQQASQDEMNVKASEWIKKFQAYLSYPGKEGHQPDMLVFVPGTSETDKFSDAQRRYVAFKTFYDEYQKSGFKSEQHWKLDDLANNKAPLRLKNFETTFADRISNVEGGVLQKIESAMSQLNKPEFKS
ncbi:MAG: hypothetical protein HOM11_01320 [Methylococcales bacterium]|jgi:hypothetical protein|nr:hypothetical protein [Methylococcales bacterium]MBT7443997.1 hypothetical protein [Methylococcales bacterium]